MIASHCKAFSTLSTYDELRHTDTLFVEAMWLKDSWTEVAPSHVRLDADGFAQALEAERVSSPALFFFQMEKAPTHEAKKKDRKTSSIVFFGVFGL